MYLNSCKYINENMQNEMYFYDYYKEFEYNHDYVNMMKYSYIYISMYAKYNYMYLCKSILFMNKFIIL